MNEDLSLAARCLAGERDALKTFDALLKVEVRRAVTPLDTGNSLVDEVTQAAHEKLLAGRKLADYSGLGRLASSRRRSPGAQSQTPRP